MALGIMLLVVGAAVVLALFGSAIATAFKRKWSWKVFSACLGFGFLVFFLLRIELMDWVRYLPSLPSGFLRSQPSAEAPEDRAARDAFRALPIDQKIRASRSIFLTKERQFERHIQLVVDEYLKGGPRFYVKWRVGDVAWTERGYASESRGDVFFVLIDGPPTFVKYKHVKGRILELNMSLEDLRKKIQEER